MIALPLKFNSLFLFGGTFPFGGPSNALMYWNSDFILSCNLSLVGLTAKSSFYTQAKEKLEKKGHSIEKKGKKKGHVSHIAGNPTR